MNNGKRWGPMREWCIDLAGDLGVRAATRGWYIPAVEHRCELVAAGELESSEIHPLPDGAVFFAHRMRQQEAVGHGG